MTESIGQTTAMFWPPVVSAQYLMALVQPVAESLAMAAGAMLIAFAVGLPLGLAVGTGVPGAHAVQRALAALRSIPDLTLAILCVVIVGLGPAAGLIAMAIYYTGAVTKMFGDVLRTAPPRPIEALQATGASRISLAFYALLPLKAADLVTCGSYEFECAVRTSVIVGAVGGGGLGSELVGSLAALDYHRTTTLILVLVSVVSAIDLATVALRRKPAMLWLLLPLGVMALWFTAPPVFAVGHAAHTFARMVPPELSTGAIARVPRLVLETCGMALGGTLIATLGAIPLGLASARTVSPAWLAIPVRRGLELLRAMPEVVWGLLLIVAVGVGPIAGTLALGFHSLGCLGRLFAECFENIPAAPVLALESTGASTIAVAAFGTVPLAAGPIAAHALFRLEWNLRMATVAGLIGAGGIGQALYEAQQLMFYRPMMAYLLITVVIVVIAEVLNDRTRRHFRLSYVPV